MTDFYLSNRRALASYFEKEWFDHVVAQGRLPPGLFTFPPFSPSLLYSDHHERVADFLSRTLIDLNLKPERLLEIGSALGRGCYEIYRRTPSLRTATLVEPSQSLATTFEHLFRGTEPRQYPVISGNTDTVEITFDNTSIREAVGELDISLLTTPHEHLRDDLGLFDLVASFNVLDNCEAPLALVERLQAHTAATGVLALSCSHQWSKTYLDTTLERTQRPHEPATDTPADAIRDLFRTGWTCVNETNIDFKHRRNERYWQVFLSQVSIFRKN